MGSSKIACVHITRENIRLVEGRVQNGVMLLTRTAIIQKANRFFRNGRLSFMSYGRSNNEALRDVEVIRELELQTIQVAMEGDKLPRTFGILGKDREFEATKSINAMTSAINPIMMLIVGAVVGVLVMSIYGPIISVSSSLG